MKTMTEMCTTFTDFIKEQRGLSDDDWKVFQETTAYLVEVLKAENKSRSKKASAFMDLERYFQGGRPARIHDWEVTVSY